MKFKRNNEMKMGGMKSLAIMCAQRYQSDQTSQMNYLMLKSWFCYLIQNQDFGRGKY